MDDEKLETLLATRALAEPSADLADRIIARAAVTPQQVPLRLMEWLERAFSELQLPKPAYSLASVMVLGLVLGSSFSQVENSTVSVDENASMAVIESAFYMEEDLL